MTVTSSLLDPIIHEQGFTIDDFYIHSHMTIVTQKISNQQS